MLPFLYMPGAPTGSRRPLWRFRVPLFVGAGILLVMSVVLLVVAGIISSF